MYATPSFFIAPILWDHTKVSKRNQNQGVKKRLCAYNFCNIEKIFCMAFCILMNHIVRGSKKIDNFLVRQDKLIYTHRNLP